MTKNNLVKFSDLGHNTSDTLNKIIEGLTGIAASEKQDWMLSLGYILQKVRAGQFLTGLLHEWKKYCEKGCIKEDYQGTNQHMTCMQELLDALEREITDEKRFELLKKILLVAASELDGISNRDSLLPCLYMQIARRLSTGEILVLFTAFHITKNRDKEIPLHQIGQAEYQDMLAQESGLNSRSLVDLYEDSLIQKRLISHIKQHDGRDKRPDYYFRLTDLGYKFCEFVEHYEKI